MTEHSAPDLSSNILQGESVKDEFRILCVKHMDSKTLVFININSSSSGARSQKVIMSLAALNSSFLQCFPLDRPRARWSYPEALKF